MKSRGFTLIELLVVVAIIGILATVVLGSLNSARGKARDAKRVADIKTIQTALELYYLENGQYPSSQGIAPSIPSSDPSNATSNNVSWENLETMMGVTLPRDPTNNIVGDDIHLANNYGYVYRNAANEHCSYRGYELRYRLEAGGTGGSVIRCNGTVTSPYGGTFLVGVSSGS